MPRRTAPGPERTVTPAWEAELLRVIELDPHAVGVASANWTTGLLAAYLAEQHRHRRQRRDGARSTCMPTTTSASARPGRSSAGRGEQAGYLGNA